MGQAAPPKAKAQAPPDWHPVQDLNMQAYLGRWYEVARLPHPYEQSLQNATVTYGKDGTLEVSGQDAVTDKVRRIRGHARLVTGKSTKLESSPAILSVTLHTWPPVHVQQVVLYTDYDRTAVVGSRNRKYLWFLSRRPYVDQQQLRFMLQVAERNGYDLRQLARNMRLVPQTLPSEEWLTDNLNIVI